MRPNRRFHGPKDTDFTNPEIKIGANDIRNDVDEALEYLGYLKRDAERKQPLCTETLQRAKSALSRLRRLATMRIPTSTDYPIVSIRIRRLIHQSYEGTQYIEVDAYSTQDYKVFARKSEEPREEIGDFYYDDPEALAGYYLQALEVGPGNFKDGSESEILFYKLTDQEGSEKVEYIDPPLQLGFPDYRESLTHNAFAKTLIGELDFMKSELEGNSHLDGDDQGKIAAHIRKLENLIFELTKHLEGYQEIRATFYEKPQEIETAKKDIIISERRRQILMDKFLDYANSRAYTGHLLEQEDFIRCAQDSQDPDEAEVIGFKFVERRDSLDDTPATQEIRYSRGLEVIFQTRFVRPETLRNLVFSFMKDGLRHALDTEY